MFSAKSWKVRGVRFVMGLSSWPGIEVGGVAPSHPIPYPIPSRPIPAAVVGALCWLLSWLPLESEASGSSCCRGVTAGTCCRAPHGGSSNSSASGAGLKSPLSLWWPLELVQVRVREVVRAWRAVRWLHGAWCVLTPA